MWKGFSTDFNGILKNLGRHRDFVKDCMQISYMETSSEAMARLEAASAAQYRQYQSDLDQIRKQLAYTIKDEEQTQLTNIREWLAVESQSHSDHDAYQRIRKEYSTTTSWILDHDTIKDWIVSDNPLTPLVWMHGIPGAGTNFASNIREAAMLIRSRQDHTRIYYN
jgi:hypothetical protein